jgi:hypothetical protein
LKLLSRGDLKSAQRGQCPKLPKVGKAIVAMLLPAGIAPTLGENRETGSAILICDNSGR